MFRNSIKITSFDFRHVDRSVICPVDQFCAADFNLAENGFPMSDIEMVMRANDDNLRAVIMQRLRPVGSEQVDPRSDGEKLRDLIPRYVQTPSEIQSFTKLFHQLYPAKEPETIEEPVTEPAVSSITERVTEPAVAS